MGIRKFYENILGNRSLLCITILACIVRVFLLPVISGDYIDYLHPWFLELKENGGVAAIGIPVGNYMVSYIYILAMLTHFPLPDIISIKIVSFIGDIVLAIYCKKLVMAIWENVRLSNIVYTTILLLPTVFLNSGAWAQCDAIYTAALVACLYYLQTEKPHIAMISFAVSFVFKLQAVFLAPLLLTLFFQKKIKLRHCLWVPLVYVITIFPAYAAGRSLEDLLLLYFNQAGTYKALSMNAPNFFAWFPAFYENTALANLGIFLAAIIMMGVAYYVKKYKIEVKGSTLLWIALFSLFWIPFALPHMHERYFFPADIISMILFLCDTKETKKILIIPTCSLLLTIRFLTGALWISPAVLSLPMFYVGIYIWKKVYRMKENAHNIISKDDQ